MTDDERRALAAFLQREAHALLAPAAALADGMTLTHGGDHRTVDQRAQVWRRPRPNASRDATARNRSAHLVGTSPQTGDLCQKAVCGYKPSKGFRDEPVRGANALLCEECESTS